MAAAPPEIDRWVEKRVLDVRPLLLNGQRRTEAVLKRGSVLYGGFRLVDLDMTIRAVLLDMDGTLVEPASTTTFLIHVCAKLGLSCSVEQIEAAGSQASTSWIADFADYRSWTRDALISLNAKFLTALGVQGDIRQLAERMHEYWVRYPDEVEEEIYPEVTGVLQTLQARHLSLAVVSHRHLALSLASLRRHRIEGYFAGVISPQLAQAPAGKLNAEMWAAALNRVNARADEVVHVDDDYEIGIRGAQKAGIRAVLIDRKGHYRRVHDCDVIEDLSGLLDLLSIERSSS